MLLLVFIQSVLLLFPYTAHTSTTPQGKFPIITGETIDGKSKTLPNDVGGKRAVVGIAFSLRADESIKKWAQPLYNHLLGGNFGGMMGGNMYNANLCFVGMLKGIAKFGMAEMKERSKKSVDAKLQPYFMLSNDDASAVMAHLAIAEKNEPHFFVLDESGNILFHTSGDYTDAKLEKLTDALLN